MDFIDALRVKPEGEDKTEHKETEVQASQETGESSLHTDNNENKVEETVVETTQVVEPTEPKVEATPYEVKEEDVLKFLSGQLGEEYSSFDTLKEKLTYKPEPSSFASEEIEQYNKFHKETGLGYDAFSFVRSVSDLDKINAKDAILADMAIKYGNVLSEEEIEFKYNQKYGKVEIDEEEMTAEEIEKYNRENKAKETDLKLDAVEAKKRLSELANQYKETKREQPKVEQEVEDTFNVEEFNKVYAQQLKDMDELTFEDSNGNEIFNFPITEERRSKYLEKIPTPQDLISEFYDEDGNIDMNQYVAWQVLKGEIDNIILAAQSQKASATEENLVKEMSNVTLETKTKQTPEGSPKMTLAEALFKQR